MPPRKSKAKTSDDGVDQTPVRRSARTRRSVAQEEYDELEVEPPKKRARSARAAASTLISYEEDGSDEPLKHPGSEEIGRTDEEVPKTPSKPGRGRGPKVSEHKDTPYPKNVPSDRIGSRGRKRREASDAMDGAVEEEGELESETTSAIKKSKLDFDQDSPLKRSAQGACALDGNGDDASLKQKKPTATPSDPDQTPILAAGTEIESGRSAVATATKDGDVFGDQALQARGQQNPPKGGPDCLKQTPQSEESVTNGDSLVGKIKPPSGTYEENIKIGDLKKDITVASFVNGSGAKPGAGSTKAALEKLENPDIVALQKSTPAAAKDAETCGFKVFGDGTTQLLVKKGTSTTPAIKIEVKEPPETQPLILLALDELNEVTSKSNRKCVEEYLTAYCMPTDEYTVFTLNVDGKVATLVNVQLETKNRAVSSLLIGCLMRRLDSRPHAFILTGHMPHVRPGTPAYELLRDGYFGNHSIETLQTMRDIKMDDEEKPYKGLIDFFWKAYQHSRPWMRSVYETVLDGESVFSGTGQAVIWHSTEGVEAVRVFNHDSIVKADLAVRSES